MVRGERQTMRMGWLAVALLALSCLASGCDRPCQRLADRLCERAGSDDAACEQWKLRTSRVPTSTCEAGLRLLDKEAFR